MIKAWLELHPLLIFLTLTIFYLGIAAALIWLTRRAPSTIQIRSLSGVAPPLFAAVAVLFALLSGFLANDIGERNRSANRAVQVEAGEMRNIHTLSVASITDMQDIRQALSLYIRAVVTEEWPAMAEHTISTRTDAAYDALLTRISNPQIARVAGTALHGALLNSAVRVGTARSERLALASDRTNTLKWTSVLLLGLIVLVAIVLVHLDHPRRAMIAALMTFCSAAIVVIGLIALQEDPFRGVFRVSPAPIERLQSLSLIVTPAHAAPAASIAPKAQ